MHRHVLTALILSVAFNLLTQPAKAVTLDFEGVVRSGGGYGSIADGDTVSGTVVYDPSSPFTLNVPAGSRYGNAISAFSMTFSTSSGDFTYTAGDGGVVVGDGVNAGGGDSLAFTADLSGPSILGTTAGGNFLVFSDPTGTVFTNEALPTGPLSQADFTGMNTNILFFENSGGTAVGSVLADITAMRLGELVIPEPATATLGLLGAAAFSMRRRRFACC